MGIEMEEELEWKVGKNITIQKTSGTGKKKKPKTVVRDSFFSGFFRTIDNEDPEKRKDLLEKTIKEAEVDMDDVEDEELEQMYEDALERVTDDAYEMGMALRSQLIPFAVRWYTGEAI